MSKQVNYSEFCTHYALDSNSSKSKNQYEEYCRNLGMFNGAIADDVTEKAIKKSKSTIKPLAYHTIQALINAVLAESLEAPEALKKLQEHCKEAKVKTALKIKDVRFNKDMQIVPIGTHGGAREGAGRKAPRGETVVKRFPERYLTAVNALIEHLDDTRGKSGAGGYTSEVNCRNLMGTLITLRFQSNSKKTEM